MHALSKLSRAEDVPHPNNIETRRKYLTIKLHTWVHLTEVHVNLTPIFAPFTLFIVTIVDHNFWKRLSELVYHG